ncbi:MAG: MFS transporter [Actinobacteria bacterium]|nr:MAG: MFS transporter [Actinomycetota bacterium]
MTRVRLAGQRTFHSLRVRNYRLFFFSQLISLSGTWMQTTAQSWLVLDLTGKSSAGFALGLMLALQFLPLLLFGVWGGVIADRLDKRRTLIWTQSSAAVLAVALWLIVLTGITQLWMIYVLAFLLGVVTVFDNPARQAFVIEMVGQDDVANAVGLNSAVFNGARLIGPAIAGISIHAIGISPSFLLNAISFIPVVAALRAMRTRELVRHERLPRSKGQIREGLRYVWREPVLRSTLLLVTVVATFGFNFIIVLPLMARYEFGGDAGLYGLLFATMAGGSLVGALLAAARARPSRPLLVGSAGAFAALAMLVALAPNALWAAIGLVPMGAFSMVFIATANSTLQLTSRHEMRGRVMALYALVFLGSTPIGGPLIGWISQQWGARAGLFLGGALSLIAAAAAAWGLRRERLRADGAHEVVALPPTFDVELEDATA